MQGCGTSVSTMWVRSSGCSMMDMKDSPRLVETNMWAMASRRSGRKAWINSRRWMACPMGAEARWGRAGEAQALSCPSARSLCSADTHA